MTARIADARAALAHLDLETRDTAIRAKSRDFFWYSPTLKRQRARRFASFSRRI